MVDKFRVSATAASRRPRQPRGQARVNIILKATAELIADAGIESINMRQVAKAAKTAVGSLYHFFPGRESLLQAVADRHAQGVGEITTRLRAYEPAEWRRMSAQQVADLLIGDYADYGRRHPSFFRIRLDLPVPRIEADFVALLMQILDARLPGVDKETQQWLAETIHGILIGGVNIASQGGREMAERFFEEIPRVLGAYLTSLDTRFVFSKGDMCD